MELWLKPHYEKDGYIIDTDVSIIDDMDFEAHVHKYYFKTGFELYMVDDSYAPTDNIVAVVETVFFNIKHIYNDDVDIQDIADVIENDFGEDISHAIDIFVNNTKYVSNDFEQSELLCYLHRLYIYPEYRDKGIGTYIFENVQDIFEYITGNKTKIIIIYPKPQEPKSNGWGASEDNDGVMLNKMISKIEQFQFYPIEDTGFYIKDFE